MDKVVVSRESGFSVGLVILLVLGFAVMAAGWIKVSRRDLWLTGARRVTWYGPNGQVLSAGDNTDIHCGVLDVELNTLIFDGAVWTTCDKKSEFPAGALARIDPVKGEGRISWILPKELSFGNNTAGLVPGSDGRMGIIYRIGDVNGPMAVGIAGRNGWIRSPESIGGDSGASFLGAAWVNGALEVVLRQASGTDQFGIKTAPVIIRLSSEGRQERRPFSSWEEMCGKLQSSACVVEMAFRRKGREGWVFGVQAYGSDALMELSEDGSSRVSDWGIKGFDTRNQLDNAVSGCLYRPLFRKAVLMPEGDIRPPKEAPDPQWEHAPAWNHFDADAGYLKYRDGWAEKGRALVYARYIGDKFISTSVPEFDNDYPLIISDVTDPAHVTQTSVARTSPFSCGELVAGTFIDRGADGYWLVTPSGCYIGLDASFRRTDPLGITEHLRRRGSIGMDWNEPQYKWYLGWVLFGYPICILLAMISARIRPGDFRQAISARLGLFSLVYLISGGYLLINLLPLLR